MVVDPLVVAAQIVLGLQTIVARNVHPADTAVVSCTEIVTDGARNAIPSEVVIRGDTRSFTGDVQALLERRMRELCDGICAAHGADLHGLLHPRVRADRQRRRRHRGSRWLPPG